MEVNLHDTWLESLSDMITKHKQWEKMFANHIYDKGLVSQIYKTLLELNNKKTTIVILKWTTGLNKYFPKENIQWPISHMKRHDQSLEKLQMKTIRNRFTHPRVTIIKSTENNKCWWQCGESSHVVGRTTK